jgi:hypothetical protein
LPTFPIVSSVAGKISSVLASSKMMRQTGTLIQSSCKLLVQDHRGQLLLNMIDRQLNHLCYVHNLHPLSRLRSTECWDQPSPGSPRTMNTNARTEHRGEIGFFLGGLKFLLFLVFLFIYSHELTAHHLTAYTWFSRQAMEVAVPHMPRAFVHRSWGPRRPLRPLATCATVTTSSGSRQALAHHIIR